MHKQRVGRNEPCPCGSGKKYKKCCYGKKILNNSTKPRNIDHILPPHDTINCGQPLLDETFFKTNTVHELSAPRFIYSILLTPEIEALASEMTNQFLDRGVIESRLIENTEDVSELMNIMLKGPDSLNQVKLKNKLLRYKNVAIPLIMQELKKPQSDAFIELAIKIIHASGEDYSNEILEIIKVNQRDAYAVALLCMVLGFYDNGETEKVLWDYYHYFKEHFRGETYSDGPLLGLEEIRAEESGMSELNAQTVS